jgi:hypothetical protein
VRGHRATAIVSLSVDLNRLSRRYPGQEEHRELFQLTICVINCSEAIAFDEQFNMGFDGPFNMNRLVCFASERINGCCATLQTRKIKSSA